MVGNVQVGGGAPIVVQSMTNTDTADVDGTVAQVSALARAGSEIVRITVDRDEAAAAVPKIRERLDRLGVDVPLVGDFHYIGHQLLATTRPAPPPSPSTGSIRAMSASRRRRTGSSARSSSRRSATQSGADRRQLGSLDQELLTHLMDENARSASPRSRGRSRARRWCSRPCSRPPAPRRSAYRRTASSCPPRSRRCRT
jgi:(E)-4-hydroxy-3-methylbut-2-enyl-diphosphate synthase